MAEERRKKGMPEPDWEKIEYFTPLPGEDLEPPEWRNVEHDLGSMNLLVDQKLGGLNADGEVEWITNEQLMLRLLDPDTVQIRWNINEGSMGRLGLTKPRVRLTVWRW